MRIAAVIVVGMFVAGLSVAAAGEIDKKAVKAELKKFQGKWKAVQITVNGIDLADDQLKATSITIKGNKFVVKTKKKDLKGKFTIDPSKTPKEINATAVQDGKEIELKGIYQWVDGRRKACFALPKYIRPGQFLTEKGYIILEWKKKK